MKTVRTIILGLSIIIAVGLYCEHITPPKTIKATTGGPVASKPPPVGIMMRVTAYCPCSRCCGKWADGITASGHKIRPGDKFCAAPKSIPFGTMLDVPGYGIVPVLDRGGAITAGRLDLFFDTHQAALNWGVKYLIIERKHMIDFRKKILAEMKRHKISIPKMARLVECNQQTLYDFFAGRTSLGSNLLTKVLSQLGGKLSF